MFAKHLILVAFGFNAMTAFDAIAQETDDALEEIVVTGSHIRQKTGYEGSSPVSIVGMEDFQAVGAQNLVDVTSMLTVNSGTIVSQETGNLIGTSQFNVRGLGVGSTLTLLNGRRAGITTVADATGVLFFDSKQLPLAMISRIDVLTDGASTIYGSDAVGGVVNLITRKGFEGVEISARYQDASNDSYMFNLASGVRTENAMFNLYATAYSQTRNQRTDFPWLVERIHGNGDLTASRLMSSLGSPETYRRAIVVGIPSVDRSATITETGARFPDPDCEAAFGVLIGGRCRFNFADQVGPIPEEHRFQAFGEMEMDVSDTFKFFAELSFSQNAIQRTQGANVYRNGLVTGGDIFVPADHPFNFWIDDPADPGNNLVYIDPSIWDNAIHTAVDLVCECRPTGYEFRGVGNYAKYNRDIDLSYYRGMLGFQWQLTDSWTLDADYIYSLAIRNFRALNNWNATTLNQSTLDGTFNPFGTSRVFPDMVSPKDGVTTAGNSDETLLYIINQERTYRRSLQQVVDITASGDLFEMNAGTVAAAIGIQYREEEFESLPDELRQKGLGNDSQRQASQSGNQDAFAIFGEVILPATDDLEIQLAVRHEDYGGTIGATTDPKIAMRWQTSENIALRGSWGTAFRGPSIPQTGRSSSSTFIDDPFQDVGGNLVCNMGPGSSDIVVVRTEGSDSLSPEESTNFSFGVVFQPIDDLSIKLDYWQFEYKNLVSADEGPQAIVNNDCNDDGIANDPRVSRAGSGQIRIITSEFINTGKVETDGFDLALDYVLPSNSFGDMNLGLAISYVNSFDVQNTDGSTFDGVGSRNFLNQFSSVPQVRANATFGWSNGAHAANLSIRYIDSYKNDQFNDYVIDSWTAVDLRYNFEFEMITDQQTSLTIGARNLFDEDPSSLGDRQRPAYDDRVHDIRGRAAYVELKHRF